MVAKGTVSKSSLILDGPGLPASRPSCGLRLPSGGTGHKQSHKRDKCRHGGGHRDYNSDRPRWAHRAASGNRRKKDQDKKKKKISQSLSLFYFFVFLFDVARAEEKASKEASQESS